MDCFLNLWGTADGSMMNVLSTIWRVVLVVLGINALIIVHEWGHFIVARMCGVRCDKFYIWFDAWGFKFFSFKWGDTEYGLGWLPLGGYVKMLGQEDNPGGIKAELERARAGVDEKGNPLEQPIDQNRLSELETAAYAPDSYLSKNVLQRMAIISAGVFMNVVFAVICAAAAVMIGIPQTSNRIGPVFPGTPAWVNDLRPGDVVSKIDGKPIAHFQQIQVEMMAGKQVEMEIKREGVDQPITLNLQPEMKKGGMTPTIGVATAASLSLAELDMPYRASLDSKKQDEREDFFAPLKKGDTIVRMNGIDVKTPADYELLARRFLAEPIRFTFAPSNKSQNKEITLPPSKLREIGLALKFGEITAVQKNSPAERAGIRVRKIGPDGSVVEHGDIPVAINNEPIIDPLKLPCQIFLMANKPNSENKEQKDIPPNGILSVVLTVLRNGEQVDIPITFPGSAAYSGILPGGGSLAVGHLGIAYQVLPVIGRIDPSISIKEGVNPLDGKIFALDMVLPNVADDEPEGVHQLLQSVAALGKTTRDKATGQWTVHFEPKTGSPKKDRAMILQWFTNYVNVLPIGTPIKVHVQLKNGENTVIAASIRETNDAFLIDRGLYFGTDISKYHAPSIGSALQWGWNKTVEMMGLVFKFLRHVGSTISPKALGGPIMIVGAAWQTTSTQDGLFLLFLCMIGANLAVVNFLPIPVLDGGHIVFLLYEAIFRRPPNENLQIALSYLGLLLILALMFWVIYLDIARYIVGS
ncbi:MAG: site-2 protease family protein [Planctomycetia bacterium]|nr:site-2 protease family protein [Planctomycetia bacterium]